MKRWFKTIAFAILALMTIVLIVMAKPQSIGEWVFLLIYVVSFLYISIFSLAEQKVSDAATRKSNEFVLSVDLSLPEVPAHLRAQCRRELLTLFHRGIVGVPKVHNLDTAREGGSEYRQYADDQEQVKRFVAEMQAVVDRYGLR
ncbi:MAG: hypothetical protein UV82_C0009G0060 [Candidatus Magasanikbacteria bacterium GW2011_GWD2_43_18]|nr:MAG: hypothetical protein UV18_C0004G0144 [Candidatus Magasanikbacteria bacterium GW2011_GWC2_42_27]KKT04321.1 MAG: hypothetical protein UV82_C0009G0060 [Candidatus Magasanikbacteria bacterium GW2011_GWD2_43_18]KKT24286.1 MAG: hypothetical protein UW10_C0030G0002 [Candidatus Magasanikbacteria bacterium GW2011_GWA2_43_9]HBB38336.1 hypothetical protein [Candidatus Magasanikbacteria bacterium]HCC14104.1 hypothetical protein [Candidatus Magasanikbacteria bacterium]